MTLIDAGAPERTAVNLQVYSTILQPDAVTAALELHATSTRARDATSGASKAKHSTWILSSEGHIASLDLRSHLDWLLDQLEPSASALRGLQEREGTKMFCTCIWWSRDTSGGPTLDPTQMARVAALRLEVHFHFSYFGPESEDEVHQDKV